MGEDGGEEQAGGGIGMWGNHTKEDDIKQNILSLLNNTIPIIMTKKRLRNHDAVRPNFAHLTCPAALTPRPAPR